LDKKLKKTKSIRTSFDLTSASTSVTGTIMATSSDEDLQRIGKILPSIGLSIVPIKEATVPNRSVDQNQAASIRSSIKRLEYMLGENSLIGERDWEITKKTNNLRNELKQIQIQLIDVPLEFTNDLTEEELNQYFNSPKVNKKYRLKTK
jgi:cob(I)alamin adenosyltransferase